MPDFHLFNFFPPKELTRDDYLQHTSKSTDPVLCLCLSFPRSAQPISLNCHEDRSGLVEAAAKAAAGAPEPILPTLLVIHSELWSQWATGTQHQWWHHPIAMLLATSMSCQAPLGSGDTRRGTRTMCLPWPFSCSHTGTHVWRNKPVWKSKICI